MISDDKFSCPPQYSDWEGYHAVPLKCYDEETATQLAELYGSNAFFCEYHECWHLGRAGFKLATNRRINMDPMQLYSTPIQPLFDKPKHFPKPAKSSKYMNENMKPFLGKPVEAIVTGVSFHPAFGCVIQYSVKSGNSNLRVYDLLDCPGVSKELSDARKLRYMNLLGTRNGTMKSAMISGRSLSGSIGTIWGHRIKNRGKHLQAVLMPFLSDSGYVFFSLLSAKVV